MKKKKLKLSKKGERILAIVAVILLIVIFWGLRDTEPADQTVRGIYVSEMLNTYAYENCDVDYCDLLSDAVRKKNDAVKKLVLLDMEGSALSDHGCVIVDLIDKIGEESFVHELGSLSWDEEKKIITYLLAGLDYTNGEHQGQKLEDAFPVITSIFSKSVK